MVGLWQNEEYLGRKELRTARDDRREIMPDCVIRVIYLHNKFYSHSLNHFRKLELAIRAQMELIETM